MNDWHTMYHEALQIRLVGLALILGVIAPGLWLLLDAAFRLRRQLPQRFSRMARPLYGHVS
jgi:hypothetical protein